MVYEEVGGGPTQPMVGKRFPGRLALLGLLGMMPSFCCFFLGKKERWLLNTT